MSAMVSSQRGSGIFVFEVSDPSAITLAGLFIEDDTVTGFDLYGDNLALITSSGLLDILDISDPENIIRLSRTRASNYGGMDIKISNGYVYVGLGDNADADTGLKISGNCL